MNRFVTITTYAKLVGINRESVYKRLKKGTAVLLESCEAPVIDLSRSKGTMTKNKWSDINDPDLPAWAR
jgi:hypothetical protein